jgi:hypothetical protein
MDSIYPNTSRVVTGTRLHLTRAHEIRLEALHTIWPHNILYSFCNFFLPASGSHNLSQEIQVGGKVQQMVGETYVHSDWNAIQGGLQGEPEQKKTIYLLSEPLFIHGYRNPRVE